MSAARAQIERHLAKPTPDHLWVIGTRAERGALLEAVARAHQGGSARHAASAYVDLGRTGPGTPETQAVARATLAALGATAGETRGTSLGDLDPALEPCRAAGKRLLLVIDGVGDARAPRASAWTRLRAWGEREPVTVVAGAGATLRALLGPPAPGAWTPWGLYYETPIRIGGGRNA